MQVGRDENLQKLGKCIKALRTARKWRRVKLSRLAFIDPATLKRIEEGKNEPKYLTLQNIIYALGLSLSEFFEYFEKLYLN